jgi:AmmeMemoRadiSam system protein B
MKKGIFISLIFFIACMTGPLVAGHAQQKLRHPVDPVGFATKDWQVDSVMARIQRLQGSHIEAAWDRNNVQKYDQWKVAICPHDDYSYAGWLYPAIIRNIRAPVVILIGVAHKAKQFGLEDRLVFDSYPAWKAPYGPVKISALRENIMSNLPRSAYIVHDSLQQAEHSLEALVPFLQYYNRDVRIVPILVPYMSFNTMDGLAQSLAVALRKVIQQKNLAWGRDIAILISNDAVHYGDEDWGGQNYAPYGCDSNGYKQAVNHEYEIINNCLVGRITKEKMRMFTGYTVQDTNYRTYRWPWCGRYSVPFGLLMADKLGDQLRTGPVTGMLIGYHTSLDQLPLPVSDIGMGTTAPANLHHWVGYVAVGYR